MRAFLTTLLALWLALGAALAQEIAKAEYERWEAIATRAETTIAEGTASDGALGQLRADLVRFRTEFQAGETINADRIKTAQEQLAALGPAPAEGETEADDVATRRQSLTEQLATLRAPVLAAEEAYERANGLIREIDNLIRSRQAELLIQRGPAPLDPANWLAALSDLTKVSVAIGQEVTEGLANANSQALLLDRLPVILVLLAIALVSLTYTGAIARRAGRYVAEKVSPELRELALLGASFIRFGLPVVGLYALVAAITQSGIPGLRGAYLVDALPVAGALLVVAAWLAAEAFPPGPRGPVALELDSAAYPAGRRAVYLTAFGFAIQSVVRHLDRFDEFGEGSVAVLEFVPMLLAAYGLWLISRKIRAAVEKQSEEQDPPAGSTIMMAIRAVTWRLGAAFAWIGPLIGAVGYMRAAEAVVYPMALTLALILIVRLLQALVSDLYVLVARAGHEARDGLVPVLLSLILATVALPVLAVIWGARWVELGELWTRISGGVAIGDSRISVTDFLTFVVVFTLGYVATRALQATLRVSVLPKTRIELGARTAIISGVGYVGIFLAALVAITTTGIDLSSLAIVAGALSVGIGFGLQTVVSNFVSGIILLIERPISEGDWIEVGGNTGIVKSISVRSTRIETFDRTDVIIPNQDLVSGTVTNWTRGNTIGRLSLHIGVAYGTDTRRVERILQEVARSHEVALHYPAPTVTFNAFGADSLEFIVRVYLRDVNQIMVVKSELNHQIAERFTKEGIEIPFAQRDVWLRNPEALRAAPPPADDAQHQIAALPGSAQDEMRGGEITDGNGDDSRDDAGKAR